MVIRNHGTLTSLTLIAALAVLVTACREGPMSSAAVAPSETAPLVMPTATKLGTGIAGSTRLGGAVVIYEQSGGFLGIHQQWTIYPDGRIQSSDGGRQSVSRLAVADLLRAIEEAGFFDLAPSGLLPGDCADCIVHMLSAAYEGELNSVTVVAGLVSDEDPYMAPIRIVNEFLTGAVATPAGN